MEELKHFSDQNRVAELDLHAYILASLCEGASLLSFKPLGM